MIGIHDPITELMTYADFEQQYPNKRKMGSARIKAELEFSRNKDIVITHNRMEDQMRLVDSTHQGYYMGLTQFADISAS